MMFVHFSKKTVISKARLDEQGKLFCLAHEYAHLINGDSVLMPRLDGKDYRAIFYSLRVEYGYSVFVQWHCGIAGFCQGTAKYNSKIVRRK